MSRTSLVRQKRSDHSFLVCFSDQGITLQGGVQGTYLRAGHSVGSLVPWTNTQSKLKSQNTG